MDEDVDVDECRVPTNPVDGEATAADVSPIGAAMVVIVDRVTGAVVDLITDGATIEEREAFYLRLVENTY